MIGHGTTADATEHAEYWPNAPSPIDNRDGYPAQIRRRQVVGQAVADSEG